MKGVTVLCCAIGMFLLVMWIEPALAAGSCTSEITDKYRAETRQAELLMSEAKQVLLDKAPEEWSAGELQNYLYYALWVAYAGAVTYYFDNELALPTELTDLADQGYIQYWPENPFDSWQPMQVVSLGDGFIPGGMVLQLAPPDYRDGKFPDSFELGVYGPDLQFGSNSDVEVLEMHEDWTVIPDGVLYMLGLG